MPKLKYTKEFKLMILELFEKGISKKELVKRFNLPSTSYIDVWLKLYNKDIIENAGASLSCRGQSIMSKEIEIAKLKERVKSLERELSEEKTKRIDAEVTSEFLEKHMPSFIASWAKDHQMIKKSKLYKHKVFTFIFETRNQDRFPITYLTKLLCVSRSKYYAWIERLGLKQGMLIPEYQSRENKDAFKLMKECKAKYGESGARTMKEVIFFTKEIRISERVILNIKRMNPSDFKHLGRIQKKSKVAGRYLHEARVRKDKVGSNFKTNKIGQVIGLDGTWLKGVRIAGKYTSVLLEMGYDWELDCAVAFTLSKTEDTNAVLSTLRKIYSFLELNDIVDCVVQCDRGTANCSIPVWEFEHNQSRFEISMSEAGFKHNPNTESMNGWNKDLFFATFGTNFESMNELENYLTTFFKQRYELKKLLYTKKREQRN